ncbi:uncharacterized protein LOC131671233 isoform X2 [Phymastichus coffea]|uniref:uncharacterized protein LOC131671233 isoform X2 n=1 Tax=Phymastichus coffea TaxID=108790 RepID=UPI00273C67BF|nr:uncharacterized protein LOC131671233 isoform X2 [Phymastichus coffea]
MAEIEVIEQYCDPKDIKERIAAEPIVRKTHPVVCTQANRNYTRPYKDLSNSDSSWENEETSDKLSNCGKRKKTSYDISSESRNFGVQVLGAEWDSTESGDLVINEGTIPEVLLLKHLIISHLDCLSTDSLPSTYLSPYYYGDLFKTSTTDYHQVVHKQQDQQQQWKHQQKSLLPQSSCHNQSLIKCRKTWNSGEPTKRTDLISYRKSPIKNQIKPILSNCLIDEWNHTFMTAHRFHGHELPNTCTYLATAEEKNQDSLELPPPPCPSEPFQSRLHFKASHKVHKLRRSRRRKPQPIAHEDDWNETEFEDENETEEDDEEMSRQHQIYETAFDCKIRRSVDNIDDLDRITNHSLLISQLKNCSTTPLSRASSSTGLSKQSQLMINHSLKEHRHKSFGFRSKKSNRVNWHQEQVLSNQLLRDSMDSTYSLSQNIKSLQINSNHEKNASSCSYADSPPSTRPLPVKFQDHDQLILQLLKASNVSSQQHRKLEQFYSKDVHLPLKSLRNNQPSTIFLAESTDYKIKSLPKSYPLESNKSILEFRSKPTSSGAGETQSQQQRSRQRSLAREKRPVQEFKGRPYESENPITRESHQQINHLDLNERDNVRRRIGYCSTESMAMSSSDGSMESLRSSTSEDNRSTSSSENAHSSSLSSHSSDSGRAGCIQNKPQLKLVEPNLVGFPGHHAPKRHILSPISDKSSQEPSNETSNNNRNNNSRKSSSEDCQMSLNINPTTTPIEYSFKKRRTPQNKNLINFALKSSSSGDTEIHGSDSGISIESKAGIKCRSLNFHSFKQQPNQQSSQLTVQQQAFNDLKQSALDSEMDLMDLPFDMPKLRRRKMFIQQQQDAATSGSATSINFKDLPFDLPKLKRRIRCLQNTDLTISEVSTNQPIKGTDAPHLFGGSLGRAKMTLNLSGSEHNGLDLGTISEVPSEQLQKPAALYLGLSLELSTSRGLADLIDVDLPLERQGWYHGSITRIEAEAILRLLREGSYLVRNSESTKQDYSLSLKNSEV